MRTPAPDRPHDTAALLRAARAGDPDAAGRLLEAYRHYLGLLARLGTGRRLRGTVDEGDVVQEAFLRAHRKLPEFRGATEAELTAWLRRILARTLANAVRRYAATGKRDVALERSLADDLDRSSRALGRGPADTGTSPSGRAARREHAVLLADALQGLPPDYREVVVLRGLEGLPFPDVAAQMGRSEDAAKKLWARALLQLRRVLRWSDDARDPR